MRRGPDLLTLWMMFVKIGVIPRKCLAENNGFNILRCRRCCSPGVITVSTDFYNFYKRDLSNN